MIVADKRLERVLTKQETLLFDGAMGTMLLAHGLQPGQLGDLLCITDPKAITAIHAAYVAAGAQVATTNTFNAVKTNLGDSTTTDEVFAAAIACARAANPAYVAADIGPTGQMLYPYGDLEHEDAYELFAEQVRAAAQHGADFILCETVPDVTEAEIAIRAAKDCANLPVFASMTFEASGFTLMGDDVASATQRMEAAGADVVGINCSQGPATLLPLVQTMASTATKPVLVQPNAGLPTYAEGQVVYDVDAPTFAQQSVAFLDAGVTILGSCCGSTPEFTKELARLL